MPTLRRPARIQRESRAGYWRLHDLAIAAGFSPEEAPFAAVRAHILFEGGRCAVNWNEVRESCAERYPEVFA